jgi:hypothetical protein
MSRSVPSGKIPAVVDEDGNLRRRAVQLGQGGVDASLFANVQAKRPDVGALGSQPGGFRLSSRKVARRQQHGVSFLREALDDRKADTAVAAGDEDPRLRRHRCSPAPSPRSAAAARRRHWRTPGRGMEM